MSSSAIGTMSARATAVVRAKVSGELMALHFKEGDEVKAGQLLAEIDPRSFQAALGQVQGTLQRDQALLKNARLDLQRYQDLLAQDSIAAPAGGHPGRAGAPAGRHRGRTRRRWTPRGCSWATRHHRAHRRPPGSAPGRPGQRGGPPDANGIVTINQVRPIDAAFAVPEAHLPQINQRLAEGARMPVELWDRE